MEPPKFLVDSAAVEESWLLKGIASMMRVLAAGTSLDASLAPALEILGKAAQADRVYIFKEHFHPQSGAPLLSQLYEWAGDNVEAQINNPDLQEIPCYPDFADLYESLLRGVPYLIIAEDTDGLLRDLLNGQDIQSIAILPIMVSQSLWGFLGFDDCKRPRIWTPQVLQMLEAASSAIGSAIERWKVDSALVEANAILQRQTEELRRVQRITISLMEDARIAQKEAARASAAKSEFLAVMSHEMRTPLNGILGFADILVEEHDPQMLREMAGIIRESGKILLDLISDVLDFSKIESGHLELDPTPTELRPMLAEILMAVSGNAVEKGVAVESLIEESVPVAVAVDDKRLRQVLLNVVGNAVKFTFEGRIEVRLGSVDSEDNKLLLQFEVEDTGIGIAESSIKQIFEPFDQANRSVHRKFGGTGLGLSISRNLCRMMGGDLTVRSRLGKGSTFSFTLCCSRAGIPAEVPDRASVFIIPRLADECPMHILVVDDVATNRLLASRLLTKMGYEADVANDGEQAVAMAAEKSYDLILMDVFMPGIDGYDTTRKIRNFKQTQGHYTVILGLSADVMNDNRLRCTEAGMDGFLTKPIRIPELISALRQFSNKTTA